MPVKWQEKDSMSADSFIKNNNIYDHIYNVFDHYSYGFRVQIFIMLKWKFLKKLFRYYGFSIAIDTFLWDSK